MKSSLHHIDIPEASHALFLGVAEKYSKNVAQSISKKDTTKHEYSLAVAGDEAYQKKVTQAVAPLRGARHVVLIGIGGSSLGTEAVYEAVAMHTNAALHVLDAIEPESLAQVERCIASVQSPEELAIIVASKSGNTTETVTNAAAFIEIAEKKFGKDTRSRIVFVGTEGSEFLENGKKEKVICVTIPESIGGRYSVFTAVGIVPLTILGLDVESFREGAEKAMEKKSRDMSIENAIALAWLAEEGTHTINFFTFNERLRSLGMWYRQLLAESIGKNMTTDGTTFPHQLLPTVSTSVDLHSMAQLYLGGYKGMVTHFIYGDIESDHHKFADHWILSHMKQLEGHTPLEIKNIIRESVLKAYNDQRLPYLYTKLPKITAFEIGYFMASEMFTVMVLGALLHVDVFNQPNVEDYKRHIREALAK